jgi:N-acetylglucosamine kinase-like BadF-type ATPase
MSLYLCVDCGGSKTAAVIADASGTIVGRAYGGPSNYAYLGPDLFRDAVRCAVSDALKTCGPHASVDPIALPPAAPEHAFAGAWFGISGVDGAKAVAECTAVLAPLLALPPGPRLVVGNDTCLLAAPLRTHPALAGAVTAIAGTGSCVVAWAVDPAAPQGALRELGRTGGWGWILGDEGGGFHVGREAMRTLMLDADTASLGGPPPPAGPGTLQHAILTYFGHTEPLALLAALHAEGPPAGALAHLAREKRLSGLAPLVFAAAFEHGDPRALHVLCTTAGELAGQIALMLRAGADADAGRPRALQAAEAALCFGGSLVGIENYRALVLDALKERGHVFAQVEFVADPAAEGAVALAAAAKLVPTQHKD